MEYSVGNTGRVIVVRLFEGENLYESIHSVAEKENIRSAAVFITGGFRKADVVVGPATEMPKVTPKFKDFSGPGEVLGVGTLYRDDEGPKLHIHTAIGSENEIIVGCPRNETTTFLILEVTIIEITGIDAERKLDQKTGLKLLSLG